MHKEVSVRMLRAASLGVVVLAGACGGNPSAGSDELNIGAGLGLVSASIRTIARGWAW
jgi:hypothetical protein